MAVAVLTSIIFSTKCIRIRSLTWVAIWDFLLVNVNMYLSIRVQARLRCGHKAKLVASLMCVRVDRFIHCESAIARLNETKSTFSQLQSFNLLFL